MTMEEYINYGLTIIKDKMDKDETYFINQNAFLNLIQDLTFPKNDTLSPNDDQPEPLD
ncbi:MAG: hypothetical protein K6F64_03670 [Clostridia bacterium]|nr:hypothetical protein [Clostridia bacterium]